MAGTDGAIHAPWMDGPLEIEEVVKKLDLILDSGATNHMVSDSGFVCEIRDLTLPVAIQVADGSKHHATAIGNIDTEHIKLEGVYVVPGLEIDVASVHQLASCDIVTTFGKYSAELYKDGVRVGGAIADGGLYKLRFLWATEPLTSPAAPRELITYAANAASSSIKKDLVPSFKDLLASIENPAVPVDWATSFEQKSLISGGLFALTAEMDENGETGGADSCNTIKDGSFVPGKAHTATGSDGMHGGDFMRVQLKEHHRLNA
ncbi:unnamed protein product [Urochloa humidicola]